MTLCTSTPTQGHCTSRLEQAAMTWSSSATPAMFTHTTHLSKI